MENVNKRAKAFNEREIEVMTDYMKLNIHKLRMNHGSGGPGMVARVREIWDELLAGVNACGNGPRTLQQIKEKWRNMVNIELVCLLLEIYIKYTPFPIIRVKLI
ncbi:hypothetical protein DPMN_027856 [Dreissena polymorpha]|uniref:Myb/SANT-like DNA-binding domain-containing protein n=1 Tax=Dreissena polymorpha TaxID=45954 RepID=A0A9D4LW41_DREPO|nr:hypothetical protein DPMN_027856 [Dreissena polymorpha]